MMQNQEIKLIIQQKKTIEALINTKKMIEAAGGYDVVREISLSKIGG